VRALWVGVAVVGSLAGCRKTPRRAPESTAFATAGCLEYVEPAASGLTWWSVAPLGDGMAALGFPPRMDDRVRDGALLVGVARGGAPWSQRILAGGNSFEMATRPGEVAAAASRGDSFDFVSLDSAGHEHAARRSHEIGGVAAMVNDIVAVSDGWVIAGSSRADWSSGEHAWIVRVDRDGKERWRQTIDLSEHDDFVTQLLPDADGGLLVAGAVLGVSPHPGFSGWLTKLDERGRRLWLREYGDRVVPLEGAVALADGFALVNWDGDRGAATVALTDRIGVVHEMHEIPIAGAQELTGAAPTPGGLVLAFQLLDPQPGVVVVASDGKRELWRSWHPAGRGWVISRSLAARPDGYLIGSMRGAPDGEVLWLRQLDSLGEECKR